MGLWLTTTDTTDTQQSETTVPDAAPTAPTAPTGSTAHTDSAAAFVPDQSRAERTASFDVAAFPLPRGREEDWRFTPVRKLGPLLAEGERGEPRRQRKLPEGVTTRRSRRAGPGLGILPPQDRAAVIAGAASDGALLLDVPADAELDEPVRARSSVRAGSPCTATSSCAPAASPRRPSSSSTPARPATPAARLRRDR